MKLGGFAGIITTMFTDRMSIRRYTDSENADGTIDTILPETALYSEVPCRVSLTSDESPKDRDVDDVPIRLAPKIFCKVGVDIKPGDFIEVKRFNDEGIVIATYAGKIGLPSVFVTHQEVLFLIDRSA